MRWIILIFLLTITTAKASAAERMMVMGAGIESCGAWLNLETENGRLERMQWIYGYSSGWNHGKGKNQVRYTDPEAMAAFLDMYCKNNPLHNLYQATKALIEETGGPPAKHNWKK